MAGSGGIEWAGCADVQRGPALDGGGRGASWRVTVSMLVSGGVDARGKFRIVSAMQQLAVNVVRAEAGANLSCGMTIQLLEGQTSHLRDSREVRFMIYRTVPSPAHGGTLDDRSC